MSGEISINSSDIQDSISILRDSLGELESNTYSYVNDNYGALEELGLVDKSLITVKRQINDIAKEQNKVIKDLKDHLDTFVETENEIVDFIKNYDNTKETVTYVSPESEYEEVDLDDVSYGKNISKDNLIKFIKEINVDVEKVLLKNLIRQADKFGTTLDELLTNPKKSGLLSELLKKLCGDTNLDINTTASIKAAKVQNELIRKIAMTGLDVINGILWASLAGSFAHLNKVAKSKNVKLEDLVHKDENKEKLMGGFRDLYLGKGTGGNTPTDNEIYSFREYVNRVAERNNTTPEQLLSNSNNVEILKKGVRL